MTHRAPVPSAVPVMVLPGQHPSQAPTPLIVLDGWQPAYQEGSLLTRKAACREGRLLTRRAACLPTPQGMPWMVLEGGWPEGLPRPQDHRTIGDVPDGPGELPLFAELKSFQMQQALSVLPGG